MRGMKGSECVQELHGLSSVSSPSPAHDLPTLEDPGPPLPLCASLEQPSPSHRLPVLILTIASLSLELILPTLPAPQPHSLLYLGKVK